MPCNQAKPSQTEVKLDDDGIPRCPHCGQVDWGESYVGPILQQIEVIRRGDSVELEWGLAEPQLEGGETNHEIYCRDCGLEATPAVAKAVYDLIG
jgi:hypothetical protein